MALNLFMIKTNKLKHGNFDSLGVEEACYPIEKPYIENMASCSFTKGTMPLPWSLEGHNPKCEVRSLHNE